MSDEGSSGASATSSTAAPAFKSANATLMRRNRLWLALGASPFVLALGLVGTAAATGKYAVLAGLFHCLMFGVIGLTFAYKWNANPTFSPGEVTADGTGVRHAGNLLAARDEIKDGFVMPYKGKTVVRLSRRGLRPAIYIAVQNVDEGRQLLRALGLDASQTVAHVRTLSRVFTMAWWKQFLLFGSPALTIFASMAVAAAIGGPKAVPAGFAIFPFVMAFLFTMALSRTHVQIGADGILTKWLGKERYFPFSEIAFVNPWEGAQMSKKYVGIEIVLRSGERVRLLNGQKRWGDEQQGILLERISEAIETYKSGMAGADASILARKGREPKDWIASLKAIGAGANADMRTASIPLERLWRVIEDASAAPLARAGAAIALAPHVPPTERKRIRVAAETTASPKLRIALERASTKDTPDEELVEAMSALEAEAPH